MLTDFAPHSAVRFSLCAILAILLQISEVLAGGLDTPPKFISGNAPVYPQSQWRSGNSGFAVVAFTVGLDGRAHDIRVLRASYPYFGIHTIIAVMDWKFEIARKNGQPLPMKMQLDVSFTSLDGSTYPRVRCRLQPILTKSDGI